MIKKNIQTYFLKNFVFKFSYNKWAMRTVFRLCISRMMYMYKYICEYTYIINVYIHVFVWYIDEVFIRYIVYICVLNKGIMSD